MRMGMGDESLMGTSVNMYQSMSSVYDDDMASCLGDSTTDRRFRRPSKILGMQWGRSKRWLGARKAGEKAPRLVDRDGAFGQSYGRWNIRRIKPFRDIQKLVESDPFHTMIHRSTSKIILEIIAAYLAIVLVFAVVYRVMSAFLPCDLGLASMREAFLFSLETMTTVGYGTNDYLFGTCWLMLPVLSAQAVIGLLIDAFLIGVLFARISRPQTRASTVVFSKHAVIRRVRQEAYFMFQVGELRKHQLLETRVRCYALRHERLTPPEESSSRGGGSSNKDYMGMSQVGGSTSSMQPDQVFFQCHYMRLQHPDDELGGNLLLVLPQTVVHRIDAWSPMMPPPRWNSSYGIVQWGLHQDKDIVKAPWEDLAPEDRGALFSRSSSEASSQEPRLKSEESLGESNQSRSQLVKKESQYWDDCASELGGDVREQDTGVGYLYRFPDLLKRWDDVDGDRGTWYEVMKRRMLRVETQRRREEERKANLAQQLEASSAARAGSNRPGPNRRRRGASIMNVDGLVGGLESLVCESGEMNGVAPLNAKSASQTSLKNFQREGNGDKRPSLHGDRSTSGGANQTMRNPAQWLAREERKAIDAYIQDRELEVVVILEGTDTSTGNTVQARHSYCWEDILWDRTFASCVTRSEDGACEVDFSRFHQTVPAPVDCTDHGFIQSYA